MARTSWPLLRRVWDNRSEILLQVMLQGPFVIAVAALLLLIGCGGMPAFAESDLLVSKGLFLASFVCAAVSLFDRLTERENQILFGCSVVVHVLLCIGACAQMISGGVKVENAPVVLGWIYNLVIAIYVLGLAVTVGSLASVAFERKSLRAQVVK